MLAFCTRLACTPLSMVAWVYHSHSDPEGTQFEIPMKGNVSGYVCNRGSPNGERETASPRLCAMLRTQASDEEVDDVFTQHLLYCGRAGSDVTGCRRPTGCVFICMLQTRVTLMAFPIATPRGRSVSFPTRGTTVTVTNIT